MNQRCKAKLNQYRVQIAGILCALAALPALAQEHAYVTTPGAGALVAFDANTLQLAGNSSVGLNPGQTAVDYPRARVYVANTGSDTISVIERPSNALLQTIAVGHQPGAIA
jgi:YVTN family beta-propeller protein